MSQWGVQRLGGLPTIVATVGAADVTVASTDTACFTPSAALIAPFQGLWAYFVTLFAVVVMGASAPTTLTFKLKTGTPTTLDTFAVSTATLVNSAIVPYGFTLVGTSSGTLYYPTGDTPSITAAAATNNATLKAGSRAVFSFVFVGD